MRIVVVDDDPELADLLERALSREGHAVATAGSAEEATDELLAAEVDLVVLDVGLPDGSGIELCRRWRARGLDVPILFLTALGDVHHRVEGLDAGGDDFLPKPFALAELRARVRALGRRHASPAPVIRRIGDVELDLGTRRARADGEAVRLTAMEWALVRELARADGRVVPRERLIDGIWEGGSGDHGATLEVLVARIRKKLGRAVIRTARGVGYALGEG